ncbi:MAG: class I SAM-dependent methyltransferase [Paracoccaceae bacterium]
MNRDSKTLSVYANRATDYAEMAVDPEQNTVLLKFLDAMPKNARVLDYGCGPGHWAAAMQRAGLRVDAFDASPEMVALASKHEGVNVQLKTFDDMRETKTYHGIWASFSLLHAPKSSFPTYLAAIHQALVPGGLLILGMKLGQGEQRDKIGRFYAYYSQAELTDHLTDAGFTTDEFVLGESAGLSGETAPYIAMNAIA